MVARGCLLLALLALAPAAAAEEQDVRLCVGPQQHEAAPAEACLRQDEIGDDPSCGSDPGSYLGSNGATVRSGPASADASAYRFCARHVGTSAEGTGLVVEASAAGHHVAAGWTAFSHVSEFGETHDCQVVVSVDDAVVGTPCPAGPPDLGYGRILPRPPE